MGHNPSFIWRSLHAAQKIMCDGCRVRIGDGRTTSIWYSAWLPSTENGFITSIVSNVWVQGRVCDIM